MVNILFIDPKELILFFLCFWWKSTRIIYGKRLPTPATQVRCQLFIPVFLLMGLRYPHPLGETQRRLCFAPIGLGIWARRIILAMRIYYNVS